MSEGSLQAYLDEALGEGERAAVSLHLERCPACTDELRQLEGASAAVRGALAALDAPAPVERALAEVQRRRPGEGAAFARRSLLRAAVLVVGFASVAAAALPGSPVRGWVAAVWAEAGTRLAAEPGEGGAADARTAAEPAARAGVSIPVRGGHFQVVVTQPSPALRLRVRLVEGDRALVQALGEAADARFLTAQGRVEVVGAGPGELQIDLPTSAATVVVEVDGRVYAAKDGARLRALAPAEERTETGLLMRVRPASR